MFGKHRPRCGQAHAAVAAVHQLKTKRLFQLLKTGAERGLRDVQPLRRPAKVKLLTEHKKMLKLPERDRHVFTH